MGRFRKMLIAGLVTQILLIVLMTPATFTANVQTHIPRIDDIAILSDDPPVSITSDADFVSQGWPGNGSISDPFIVEDLTITSDMTCISISDTSSYFIIRDCILTITDDYERTMILNNVQNGIISSNTITFDMIGIDLVGCQSCTIEGNTVHRPELPDKPDIHGIRVYDSSHVSISRNDISSILIGHSSSSNRGILVDTSTHCTIQENTVNPFMGRGIYLESSAYCDVIDNQCQDCITGYYIRASNDCYVEGNIAFRTGMGFGVWVGQNHILRNNRVGGNTGEGYVIANSYDCSLIGNVVEYITYSNGIELIYGAANNIIYSNFIFCDNVLDNGTNNHWDNGIDTGNYWSSYIEPGPYLIPGSAGSVDHYPTQFIEPSIELVSITEFEYGRVNRTISWTYSDQAPTNYTLEILDEFQTYTVESEGIWNESLPSLSLNLEPTAVGTYHYRFSAIYEGGYSITEDVVVYIVPASSPHIGYVSSGPTYPAPWDDIEVEVFVSDISEVSDVILEYSTSNEQYVHNITMSKIDANEWSAIVPGQPNNTRLHMTIFANDTLGNSGYSGLIEKLVTDSPPVSATTPPRPPDNETWWLAMILMMVGVTMVISFIGYIDHIRRYK